MANIIFDYDGTLHDCAKIYVPAFRVGHRYLVEKGFLEYREYPDEEVISYLGYSPKQMWEQFAPQLSGELKRRVTMIVSDEMARLTDEGKSVFYEGVEETLQTLAESGHRLIFLSNCLHSYMEQHRTAHGLDRFFSGYYCSEDYGYKPKPVIFRETIKPQQGTYSDKFIVVGDRRFDLETAWENGLSSVGCLYGYAPKGELDNADRLISDIRQLPKAIGELE